MKIEKCPLCHGDVYVRKLFITPKEFVHKNEFPAIRDCPVAYYCACDKNCLTVAAPDLIVGEKYDTVQEAVTAWNDFVTQWNKTLKGGDE